MHTGGWNQEAVLALVPGAYVITTLRDPLELFESVYTYFRLQRVFGLTLENFALRTGNLTPEENMAARKW